ncbi:MAG: hypothetical protein WCP46_00090 [Alphaproteobacteria bacterium]
MTQNKNLKAYARYDSQNRIVSSSVVLRTKKPSGNFQEVKGYLCCNKIFSVSATPTGTFTTTTTITVTCGGTDLLLSVVSDLDLTPAEIVTALLPYTAVGTFSTDNTSVTLTGPICDNATLAIVKA